jgi:exonuclease SbcD
MTRDEYSGRSLGEILLAIEERLGRAIDEFASAADPELPLILAAHASVQGASHGSERSVMLGQELTLSGSLVFDSRFDYVGLGHIHLHQSLNGDRHPPTVYAGSIERIDFGEAHDKKYFVIAHLEKGKNTNVEWKEIDGTRPFIERRTTIISTENVTEHLIRTLPTPDRMNEAIVKLTIEYPREMDVLIDETALRKYTECCFEFHLVKRPKSEARVRIPEGQTVSSLSPLELLTQYFEASKVHESDELQQLAREIIAGDSPET